MRLMLATFALSLGAGVAFAADRPLPEECGRTIDDVRQQVKANDSISTPIALTIVSDDSAARMIKMINRVAGTQVTADQLLVLTSLNTGDRVVFFVDEGCVNERGLPVSRADWQRIAAQ